jgi:hypothetical protein
MEGCSRTATTIAVAIFGISMLGLSTLGWAQKPYQGHISDMESTDSKTNSLTATTSSSKTGSSTTAISTSTASRETHGHLLTQHEGLALAKLALTEPEDPDDQPDCSHLVHQIFQAEGFDYPYVPSFTLYDGVPEFQRVSTPQPGDLIVWQGHVGIVIDPLEHSFYSSVGSGFQTEQYDSDYWRGRGPSRFYRYLVGASTDVATLRKPPQWQAPKTLNENAENDNQDPANNAIASAGSLRRVATNVGDRDSVKPFQVPESIPIPSAQAKPTSESVSEAISELTNASGGVLRMDGTTSSSVVIFDQLRIEKMEIKRDKGWAEVRVDYRVELNQGQLKNQRHSEKRRWELRRTRDGWMVMKPADRTYVPADVAEQVISERLYKLTKKSSDKNRGEQANLARLLDAVFN